MLITLHGPHTNETIIFHGPKCNNEAKYTNKVPSSIKGKTESFHTENWFQHFKALKVHWSTYIKCMKIKQLSLYIYRKQSVNPWEVGKIHHHHHHHHHSH
ncbi:hypothetical protein V6Z11_A06G031000 [Gossypium hirsutum]